VTTTTEPTLRERWIKALRSGKYQQARRTLVQRDKTNGTASFCCLGVLCDVFSPDGWNGTKYRADGQISGRASYPPVAILREVGLDAVTARQLARYNDNEEWSFDEIANFLETGSNNG
jgi:hypothetical protein